MVCTFYERVITTEHTFSGFRAKSSYAGLILCLCGAFPAPLLWGDPACYRRSPRTEHLLIYRIQSHTNPKRRKVFLKQAGQKSVKEELPKQRKGSKRTEECRLKVPTHIWELEAVSSSLTTPTTGVRPGPEPALGSGIFIRIRGPATISQALLFTIRTAVLAVSI